MISIKLYDIELLKQKIVTMKEIIHIQKVLKMKRYEKQRQERVDGLLRHQGKKT